MKNLKMFAIGLVAMAAMTMGVYAGTIETDPAKCTGNFYVDLGDSKYSCAATIRDAIDAAKTNKGGEIVLLKNATMTSDNTIDTDVTINLNDNKLTISNGKKLIIKGANVTIKNGTIDAASSVTNAIEVYSTDDASTLTIEKDVTVDGTNISGAVIKVKDASKKTEVNINGTWDLKNEIIDCDNGQDRDLTVNLNADVTGTSLSGSLVTLDAGNSVVNVLGGSYEADKTVFALTNGTLNISGGKITSTGSNAVKIANPTGNNKNALNITGGELISTHKGSYSLYFAVGSSSTKGTYAISKGTFTSGKDDDGNQLPAINIADKNFLANHANMISGGSFIGAIVDDVLVGDDVYQTAAAAVKALTGNATVTNEGGVVTVGTTATTEPEQQGPNTGDGTQTTDPGTTNPDVPNVPKTSDNILVYASLGVVSLVSVGFSTKRKENN